ncbi:EAL domain-containing protein [Clostridium sp. CS001]|uniref:bifunctional diguanylate cyclase/phosphodiesterase n=1 Tax=Clostridium sp. CS001 TaxID=2880648 RepID=UPI001CF5BF73|nr:EAL domain-containing protein [Clostridium sp. CS001]MCB2291657.1 EAL domain-containing protein [Clostridium sp. CS001]
MIKNKNNSWNKKIKHFKYFIFIFLPLMISFLLTLFMVNNLQTQKNKQILMERERSIGKINKLNIQTTFNSVTADVKVIKDSNEINDYINNPTINTLSNLNEMFFRFSKNKRIYNQLRLIDTKGMEIARVDYNDGNVRIVTPKELQNKKDREYFNGTLNMKSEEIYISKFDLNTENGQVEYPIKPIIRFGVPVFKSNGEKFGIMVFNYLGKDVLDKINENLEQKSNFHIELLNADGYFLKSEENANDWNFMYENKKYISFKSKNKDIWDAISTNESGTIENKTNIYYYDTIYPLYNVREKKDANFSQDNGYTYWKAIVSYPKEKFDFIKSLKENGFWVIGCIFIIIIMISSAITSYVIVKRQEFLKGVKASSRVFDNSKEAILITNAETHITYTNKAFLLITGYKKEEVLGIKTSAFKSGRHNEEFYKNMWQSIKNNGNWQGEIWDRKKDGTFYPKLLNILAIKGDSDEDLQYVGIFEDLTLLKEKEASIDLLKNYDRLTSLPNLSLMKQLMYEKIIKNSNNVDYKYSLVSITVTNYDIVKNGLGLKKADSLIITALKRIKNHMEDGFIISSPGKNEFMILLEYNKEHNTLFQFINNILKEFKKPFVLEDEEILIQLAVGVASYGKHSDTIELLIENANIAKVYAEEAEDNVQFYKAEFKDKYLKSIKMRYLLRGALESGELYLTYQPQVDLASGQIVGAEALIRWKNPEIGSVSPVTFIPIAEKTELIIPIGKWVLDEACRQNKRWRDQNLKPILMSVNISPIQFKKVDIFEIIQSTLDKHGLKGESLEIEVTEGLLLENDPKLLIQLNNINNIGVRLAMDDFGTGYSSLSYLRKFKFDKIKIDREFVKDYPENDNGTIAKTIINLSKSLGIKVIAEGAETQDQIDFLSENKCDQIQGYYYSPPVLPEEFEELLRGGQFIGGE